MADIPRESLRAAAVVVHDLACQYQVPPGLPSSECAYWGHHLQLADAVLTAAAAARPDLAADVRELRERLDAHLATCPAPATPPVRDPGSTIAAVTAVAPARGKPPARMGFAPLTSGSRGRPYTQADEDAIQAEIAESARKGLI